MEDIASVAVDDAIGSDDGHDDGHDDGDGGGEEEAGSDATTDDDADAEVDEIETFFDDGDASKVMLEFEELLKSDQIPLLGKRVLKIVELMQLGKIEKGALVPDGKYTSLVARWFNTKKKKKASGEEAASIEANEGVYIERNSVVKMKCKQGSTTTVESYRVLAIFSKFYNKWHLEWDNDRILFQNGSKKYKILARMVRRVGGSGQYEEVDLEKGGGWGPRAVYCLKKISAIESVEAHLGSGV